MKARDTVKPSSSVKEVAKTFLERRISAAPVVDDQGKLVGIVSWTAPHPWTRLLGFFQPVPVSAGRMPLHPQLAPSHKLIMNEVHRPGLVRSCGRLPILAQLLP